MGVVLVITALLGYLVRDQRIARKERQALARQLNELDEALRKRHGHERAQELLATVTAELAADPGSRHLKIVPPVAAITAAADWTRDHRPIAVLALTGATVALAAAAYSAQPADETTVDQTADASTSRAVDHVPVDRLGIG